MCQIANLKFNVRQSKNYCQSILKNINRFVKYKIYKVFKKFYSDYYIIDID